MSSSLNLTNLNYEEKNIGTTFKISKRYFKWDFVLNGSSERIELFDSRWSGKKKLIKNGMVLSEEVDQGQYMKTFDINGHQCVIIQYGDKIELRIDNQSFTHLYNLQKNKELFAGQKGPTSNIYITKGFDNFSSDDNKKKKNDTALFYKVNKPDEQNKPQLFNFSINKNETKHNNVNKFKNFKFGAKMGNDSAKPANDNNGNNNNNVNTNNNNDNNNSGNKENVNLLEFQGNDDNNSQNNTQNNANNVNNNNNNLLDIFGGSNNNNQQNNNQFNNNNQNLLGFGSSNPSSNNNNINLLNEIFPALPDNNVNNPQQNFNENNLDFMSPGNNNNINNSNNNFNNNNFNNAPQKEEFNYPGMDEIFGNNNQNIQNPNNNNLDLNMPGIPPANNNGTNANQPNNNNQLNNPLSGIF